MAQRTAQTSSSAASNPVRVRFATFELDEADARLLRDGKPVVLAPTPFALLCALARQPGSLLTKHALLDQVWGHQFVSDSVLKTAISDLRTVLDDDARKPRFIETVSRRGYRFIATTSAVSVAPRMPASVSEIGPPRTASFIGRTEALSQLSASWELACAGKCRIVWVTGEPGIGKTALVEHFIAGLGDIICVRGQCVDHFGSGEPYLPVLEAVSELCRKDSTLVPLLRAVAPTWLLQMPWLCNPEERDSLRRELAGVSPDRMLREMGEVLDRSGERRPLLLVTEDLHWSDRSTLQLIDYIARRRGSARLMWLASFRLAEVVALEHPLNPLRHELRVHGLCEEIVLDPFSETEVADFVAHQSPSLAADEAFVRALHERTDGVPLFVASVVTDVMARAAHGGADAAGAQLAELAIRDNLATIIDYYIAKLGSEDRALLSAAAVCGVEFRINTISDVLERDAASIAATCDQLVREQLWLNAPRTEGGTDAPEHPYSFRHALFRQVLYDRTPAVSRAQLHGKAGVALQRERAAGVPIAATELAMHFERGRDPMLASRYYAEAAEDALAHLSPAETVTLTERGLGLLHQAAEGTERNTLEIDLATLSGIAATHVFGMGLEAKTAFERAYSLVREVPQHRMLGRLLHGLGFVLCLRTDYAEALAVADRAEALSSATKDPLLMLAACIVHGEVDQRQGRSASSRSWIERGLALAESLDVAPQQTFVADLQVTLLAMLAVPLLHLGLVKQARARLQQAHAQADALRQPMSSLVAIWYDALCEVRLGNAERVAALADRMCTLVDEFGLAQGRIACRWFRGWADARMGKPREAYREIREAYEENTRLGMLAGGSEVRGYAAEALVLAGEFDAAQHELEKALGFADKHAERVYLPQLFLVEASIARARGQSATAHASVLRAVAESRRQQAPWLELITLLELCKTHGAKSEDLRALAALLARLPEAAGTTAVASARGLLDNAKSR